MYKEKSGNPGPKVSFSFFINVTIFKIISAKKLENQIVDSDSNYSHFGEKKIITTLAI
jgi:hypothetical protein